MNKGRRSSEWLLNLLLTVAAVIWLLPLAWTLLVSLRPADEPITSGHIWFGSTLTADSYRNAFQIAPFGTYYLNTIIIVTGIIAVQVLTTTLAGYAFARFEFPGKNLLFALLLLQILIPSAVLVIPNYATIRTLGLFDNRLAIMLPYFGSAFGTFLMRQTF